MGPLQDGFSNENTNGTKQYFYVRSNVTYAIISLYLSSLANLPTLQAKCSTKAAAKSKPAPETGSPDGGSGSTSENWVYMHA